MLIEISLFSAFILLIGFVAGFCLKPLINFRKKLSHETRETVFPEIIEIDKTVITISSAAIVLTAHFIDKNLDFENYLVFSWIGFLITIACGVIVLISHYSHRVVDNILINFVSKNINAEGKLNFKRKDDKSATGELHKHQKRLSTNLIVWIFLQAFFLLMSLSFLVLFGIRNLTPKFCGC